MQRRQLNQTFYERFFLKDRDTIAVARDVVDPPFDELHEASWVDAPQKALPIAERRDRKR